MEAHEILIAMRTRTRGAAKFASMNKSLDFASISDDEIDFKPGRMAARFVACQIVGKGNVDAAVAYLDGKGALWRGHHEIARAVKAATTATSMADYQVLVSPIGVDFVAYERPRTLIGRMPAVRQVPMMTRMVNQTTGTVAAFVGEGVTMPVTSAVFDAPTFLRPAKIGSIAVTTIELAQMSTPAAQTVLIDDMGGANIQGLDEEFADPTIAPSDLRPGSIFHGAPSVASSGSTLAAVDADLAGLIRCLTAADVSLDAAVFTMHPNTATYLAQLRGTSGSAAFPDIGPKGGFLLKIPVLTSAAIKAAGSPGTRIIGLVDQSSVLLADEGRAEFEVTTEGALQLDTAPSAGAQSQVSLFQSNLAAIKVTRWIRWQLRRAAGAAYLSGVTY